MTHHPSPLLYRLGGIGGILGTMFYIIAIAAPLPSRIGYALAIGWPVLTILFAYALYQFIRQEQDSAPMQLSFVFACLAFTLLAAMLSVQVAVRSGMEDMVASDPSSTVPEYLLQVLRLVDMGIDVAWDVFIGVSLLFMAFALKGNSNFGMWWGLPAGLLAAALIVLNLATFPWPPADRGLVDVGPLVGLFIISLSARLIVVAGRTHDGTAE